MNVYHCRVAPGPLDAVVHVPGSKSLTNRALLLAALADGAGVLDNILLAEDSSLMVAALRALGIAIAVDETGPRAEVTGCRGVLPVGEADLFCGNSGTTMRFLAALCALGRGSFTLDGLPRMRQRPIGALGSVLQSLGCGVEYPELEGFPPIRLHAEGLRGGHVDFDSPESSQMVSAVLMAAPYAARDVFVEVKGELPSYPFVEMTLRLMERFGVVTLRSDTAASRLSPEDAGDKEDAAQAPWCSEVPGGLEPAAWNNIRFIIEAPQRYRAVNLSIEPDATNAMYFLAAAGVCGGRVTVEGLGRTSVQGDVAFIDVLEELGCRAIRGAEQLTIEGPRPGERLLGVDVNLADMPDTAQTLAVIALFADGPTRLRGLGTLRVKETDRLAALSQELTKLGARVEEGADELTIHPPSQLRPAEIDTYDDHRMAMSFALAGLRVPGVAIRDPQCCGKTFPGYFDRLEAMVASPRSSAQPPT